jgi:hypothetical protein
MKHGASISDGIRRAELIDIDGTTTASGNDALAENYGLLLGRLYECFQLYSAARPLWRTKFVFWKCIPPRWRRSGRVSSLRNFTSSHITCLSLPVIGYRSVCPQNSAWNRVIRCSTNWNEIWPASLNRNANSRQSGNAYWSDPIRLLPVTLPVNASARNAIFQTPKPNLLTANAPNDRSIRPSLSKSSFVVYRAVFYAVFVLKILYSIVAKSFCLHCVCCERALQQQQGASKRDSRDRQHFDVINQNNS